jgi:catecholate siderophore receptor
VQRTRGIELSAQLELSEGWQAIASYAYLDARITKSPALDSGVRIQGNRPTLTPVNSASLWLMRISGSASALAAASTMSAIARPISRTPSFCRNM